MNWGKAIPIFFAAVVVVGAGIVVAYKIQEARLPPISLTIERVDATAAGNATIHHLDPTDVHRQNFLEAHLETAGERGVSIETERIRVETMRDYIRGVTGAGGPMWYVEWNGAIERVTLGGGP
jgi:hypothetical protein